MADANNNAQGGANVSDLFSVVSSISRFWVGFTKHAAFARCHISLSEWMALSALGEKDGVSNTLLARSLGGTGQRVNQLVRALEEKKLISTSQSTEDRRQIKITITDDGRKVLGSVNSELKILLEEVYKNRERALPGMARQMRYLMRLQQKRPGGDVLPA